MMPQVPALHPYFSCVELLRYYAALAGISSTGERCREVLASLHLQHKVKHYRLCFVLELGIFYFMFGQDVDVICQYSIIIWFKSP